MRVFKTIEEIKYGLKEFQHPKTIGFVPTMGALHQGHLSLIHQSKSDCDVTVCSIFVNPKQFNKQEDLVNYPRNLDKDISLLKEVECDFLFCPTVEGMYPANEIKEFHFGSIAQTMEGEHRPGHFNGVALVIERFFEILNPTKAYFGEKDFQQLALVKALVNQIHSSVKIIGCETLREESGLAMSSRNERLTAEERVAAAEIYKALMTISCTKETADVRQAKNNFVRTINSNPYLKV